MEFGTSLVLIWNDLFCHFCWTEIFLLESVPLFLHVFSLFSQLNPDVNVFQRKFVNEVRRCEEMDRKLSKRAKMFLRYMKILSDLAPQVNDQPGPGQIDILSYFKMSFKRFFISLDRCTNKYPVKFKFFATTCKSHRYYNFYISFWFFKAPNTENKRVVPRGFYASPPLPSVQDLWKKK